MTCCETANVVALGSLEVDQSDGDVLVVLADGKRVLAEQPRSEALVGAHQSLGVGGEQVPAQLAHDFFGVLGMGGDGRVEAFERFD